MGNDRIFTSVGKVQCRCDEEIRVFTLPFPTDFETRGRESGELSVDGRERRDGWVEAQETHIFPARILYGAQIAVRRSHDKQPYVNIDRHSICDHM